MGLDGAQRAYAGQVDNLPPIVNRPSLMGRLPIGRQDTIPPHKNISAPRLLYSKTGTLIS